MTLAPGQWRRSNCPRDCYDGCGMRIENRAGRMVVRGDPDHPVSRGQLCGKCTAAYNGIWQDPAARLLHPLVRSGAKGAGEFRRVTWEQALDHVAVRLAEIIASRGPEHILNAHYTGTLSLLAYCFPMRLGNALGLREVEPDTVCNIAGHLGWRLLFGESAVGFDPRTIDDAACVLVWGANPAHSAPHQHRHWLGESHAKVVVVDPLRTATARAADIHLRPRPGSDAALAFGLLHELRALGAFDTEFIASAVSGAEEISAFIDAATPEATARLTGVAEDALRVAAAAYADGPALLWAGQALTRQAGGGNVMRSVGLLPALTGNIGKPGAGFCFVNATPAIAGLDFAELVGAGLRKARTPSLSHVALADELGSAERSSALLCWNMNPLQSGPRQGALRHALRREDLFTVVIDCFVTDTTDYADVVLPAASFLEFDDLTFSYFNLMIGAQSKVSDPLGEALPNQEIFRRLGHAMGLDEPALQDTDEALIERMLRQMGIDGGFAELQRDGFRYLAPEPMVFYRDRRFPTASGKIEVASERAQQMGLPRVPVPEVEAAPLAGRMRLISPASEWRLNGSYANQSNPAARDAGVHIHPDDAERLGIRHGQEVRLGNECGRVTLAAVIDDLAPPGTVVVYKGRWPKLEGGASVNLLHPGTTTDMGEGNAVHSVTVTLQPA